MGFLVFFVVGLYIFRRWILNMDDWSFFLPEDEFAQEDEGDTREYWDYDDGSEYDRYIDSLDYPEDF